MHGSRLRADLEKARRQDAHWLGLENRAVLQLMAKHPERRVSPFSDRRLTQRGGRRSTDEEEWSTPPPVVPCSACHTGTAGIFTCLPEGAMSTVTYLCRDCGRQFDRIW
jgi:hypothetical protein